MAQSSVAGAELTVDTGLLAGTRFLLDRPLITIGRADENDIKLEDDMVSKNHCRIITQGDNYLIEDLGSSNGTIVNGAQVSTYMLQDGDKLFLGETTLSFRKTLSAIASPVQAAAKEPGGRKWIWISAAIIGGLVLVATAVVLVLLLVVLPERDSVPPSTSFQTPTPNQTFLINMPVPQGSQVPITVRASDNKGLDRVTLTADSNVPLKTFKATTSRKESPGTGNKTESFSMTWNPGTGDHVLKVTAYDWKGNVSNTETLPIKVDLSPDVNNAHAYCQQIDQKIGEYTAYRAKFNQAYSGAQNGSMSWLDAGTVFSTVLQERQGLLDSLNSMTPPGQFNESHSALKTMVTYAINADEAAVEWASAMYYATDPTYYYYTSTTDPATYKNQVDEWSDRTQQAANTFNSVYAVNRQNQLGIGPGPKPQ